MVNLGGSGFFACVEGLDGCGKTTQTKLLVEILRRKGYDAVYTTEPTQGEIGVFIRKYCLRGKTRVSGIVEALLFAADRFEHVKEEVAPAVDEEKLVVSDRYVFSSFAYQGAAGLDFEWIRAINEYVITPNLAIFIDVKPQTVIQRLKANRSVMENLETLLRARKIYLKFVEKGELVKIDGNRSKQRVADDILAVVLRCLENSV